MTDDVLLGEMNHGDALHAVQDLRGLDQSRTDVGGQVDLGHVSRDHGPRSVAQTCQKHLHLFRRGVLGFVEDNEGVVQGASAHKSQGRDLDGADADHLLHLGVVEHVIECIVKGTQVGVHLLHEVAGQKTELLAGLYRRPGQNQPFDLLLQKQRHSHGHGQIGLARAGRTYAQGQVEFAHGVQVFTLGYSLGTDGLARGKR